MASTRSQFAFKSWVKGSHLISTDPNLIPIPRLITILDSEEFYWAKSIPTEAAKEMLENSLVFGLYECTSESEQKTAVVSSLSIRPQQASTACLRHLDANAEPPIYADLDFIGLARCITDYTTFLYLTDVWVDPAHQGSGLGRWLISTIQEVIESMPYLRRSILFTSDWQRSVPFYEKLMGMSVLETKPGEGLAVMERKWKGHPNFGY
jgi:GNAT superfamily N-acetyltransferase